MEGWSKEVSKKKRKETISQTTRRLNYKKKKEEATTARQREKNLKGRNGMHTRDARVVALLCGMKVVLPTT